MPLCHAFYATMGITALEVQSMKTSVREADGITFIAFEGEMDTSTSPEAEALFARLIGEGKTKLIVNFSKLNYITSAGISVLMKTEKQLKSINGQIAFGGVALGSSLIVNSTEWVDEALFYRFVKSMNISIYGLIALPSKNPLIRFDIINIFYY